MRRIALSSTILGALLALTLHTGSAQAQATRTWVSGVGDDANPCSRTAPCKTFAGAISKTATDGEINCLDPAGYGAVTITKGMTINCEHTLGSVLVSGTNGIVVSPPAGQTIKVTLKGLEFEGLGTGINAISMIGQGAILHLHKIQIRKFTTNGINWTPSLASELYVSEAYISECGTAAGTGGILIAPQAGGTTIAAIENVKLENNLNGVVTTATNGVGVNVTIKNSTATGSNTGTGFFFNASSTNVVGMLQSIVASNNSVGVAVTNSAVRIGMSAISGNGTGVNGGSGLTSYKNNQIDGNPTNGTPIAAATLN
jgi:hypothetical protein